MFNPIQISPKGINTGFPITQAVVEGKQEGSVYKCRDNYFVLHKSGFGALSLKDNCYTELIQLFQQKEIPAYFHLYDANSELITMLQSYQYAFKFWTRNRIQLNYTQPTTLLPKRVDGFYVENITTANYNNLDRFQLRLDSHFWNNRVDFIDNAQGVVVFNHNKSAVGICYAAAIANHLAEIDVFTLKEFRGKGLAKLAVSHYVNNCIHNKLTPNWDCFETNEGSLKTALSLSFLKQKQYIFLSINKQA